MKYKGYIEIDQYSPYFMKGYIMGTSGDEWFEKYMEAVALLEQCESWFAFKDKSPNTINTNYFLFKSELDEFLKGTGNG